jgi:hypothetical protein
MFIADFSAESRRLLKSAICAFEVTLRLQYLGLVPQVALETVVIVQGTAYLLLFLEFRERL